jgi:hypothetical protein
VSPLALSRLLEGLSLAKTPSTIKKDTWYMRLRPVRKKEADLSCDVFVHHCVLFLQVAEIAVMQAVA